MARKEGFSHFLKVFNDFCMVFWEFSCLGMIPKALRSHVMCFRGEMRVLAKFQINLAIPKDVEGYLSTRGRG